MGWYSDNLALAAADSDGHTSADSGDSGGAAPSRYSDTRAAERRYRRFTGAVCGATHNSHCDSAPEKEKESARACHST